MKRVFLVSILSCIISIIIPLISGVKPQAEEIEMEITKETEKPQETPALSEITSRISDKETNVKVLQDGKITEKSLEEHLPFVLASEMPVSFEKEALKAQAVAARTYIMYCKDHKNPKHEDADICCDSGCCLACLRENELRGAWGKDFDNNMEIVKAAVKETDGQVMYYEDEPILASFHSSSAGMTEDGAELWGAVPYLSSVPSPETENDVPDYVTRVEVSPKDFKESILFYKSEADFSASCENWIGETDRDKSGRVRTQIVAGVTLTGSELRSLFTLRSTAFTIEYKDGAFVFTVTGFGHGLGLSQYGANVMAKNGFDYSEIVSHYYPNANLG